LSPTEETEYNTCSLDAGNDFESLHANTCRNAWRTLYKYSYGGSLLETHALLVNSEESVTETSYNALGHIDQTIDPMGVRTKDIYDIQGRLIEIRYNYNESDGTWAASVQFGYDANGQKIWEKDRAGRMTHFSYDKVGRRVKTTYEDGSSISTVYDTVARVGSTTDRNGNLTRFEYDQLGRQKAVTDALGNTTEYSYDEVGNLKSVTDALGHKTEFEYDALNRRIKTIFADGTFTRTEYDKLGRVEKEIDQENRVKEFGYDSMGRLTSVTQWIDKNVLESFVTTHYDYDVRGNRIHIKDALWEQNNHRVTAFQYDIRGRLTAKIYPLCEGQQEADQELYFNDPAGRLTTKTTPNLDDITYQYDFEGRETVRSYDYNGNVTWTFDYNADGSRQKVTRAWDGHGSHEWNYTYDPYSGWLVSVTDPFDRAISYEYDKNGNRAALTTPQGRQEFTFDALNRLVSTKDKVGTSEEVEYTYTYEGPALLRELNYPNGIKTTYTYDNLNRLKNIEHKDSSTLYSSFNYTLSPSGLRTAVDEKLRNEDDVLLDNLRVDYTYDDLNRLTGETRTGQYQPYSISYEYDNVGNRTKLTRNSTDTYYKYNERDFLLSESPILNDPNPPVTYAFDANGNMVSKVVDQDMTYTYGWDPENRMRTYSEGSTEIARFQYDNDGVRYYRDNADQTPTVFTEFLVDQQRPYADVLEEYGEGSPGLPALKIEYFHGAELLAEKRPDEDSAYFLADGQFSTRQRITPEKSVATLLSYEAFGNDLPQNSTGSTQYRYNRQQREDLLAVYYLRARYMSPAVGRFWSEDPVGSTREKAVTLDRFVYAFNEPVANWDPTGLQAEPDTLEDIAAEQATEGELQGMANSAAWPVYKQILAILFIAGCLTDSAVRTYRRLFPAFDPATEDRRRPSPRETTLDTSVLIDAERNNPLTTGWLVMNRGNCITSTHALEEFLRGRTGTPYRFEALLKKYDIELELAGSAIAYLYALYLRDKNIGTNFAQPPSKDMEIAMHAMVTLTRLGSTNERLLVAVDKYNGWVRSTGRRLGFWEIAPLPIPH
jgi:RHS repeat-associated protein